MSDVTPETTIPVIDLTAFLAGGDPAVTAAAIRQACEEVGFFQIVGHGVSPDLFASVVDSMRSLAELSVEDLAGLVSPTGHPFRGVIAAHDADGTARKVRLQANRFDDPSDAMAHGVPLEFADYFHPNVWPHQVPLFKERWVACMTATRELGRRIMSLFATALWLPADYFDEALELDITVLGANYYPSQASLSAPGVPNIILPAHEDSGVLTVLFQTGDYTGLQLRCATGEWIEVPVVEGSLVVNIGDLMARWTNGKWKSTTHRVVAANEPGKSRISIPTFYLPAVDTVIAPLTSCVGDGEPLYDPVTPYDWEAEFFKKPYDDDLGEHPGRVEVVR